MWVFISLCQNINYRIIFHKFQHRKHEKVHLQQNTISFIKPHFLKFPALNKLYLDNLKAIFLILDLKTLKINSI